MSKFKVIIQPAGVELTCTPGTTVLDAALAAGFFPHHSCRRGQCNSCEARLVTGEVRYPDGFVPERVTEGCVLTCQASVVSDMTIVAPEVLPTPGQRVVQAGARVLDVERISHDVARVRLQMPPAAGFAFRAGQYVDVILRDGARRSYSMANAPGVDNVIEWHVRAVPGGRFSNHVYRTLKARDLLRIEGPFGTFTLQETIAPIILLASGTGYAPIAAMLKAHEAEIARRGAVLYWGGVRLADLYAYDEVMEFERSRAEFRFVPVLSGVESGWMGRTGFVHEAVAADFPDLSEHEVYACGNPLMIDAARNLFVSENRLKPEKFFSDAFITRKEEKRADDAQTVGADASAS